MTAEARTALLLAAAALGLAGCRGADARALDRICEARLNDGPACEIDGFGAIGSGVTSDAIGATLHDGGLVVHLAAVPELGAPGPFEISLLTVARTLDTTFDFSIFWGSCAEGCPTGLQTSEATLPRDIAWVTVASGVRGSEPGAPIPYDAVMTFAAVEFDILDLRVSATP